MKHMASKMKKGGLQKALTNAKIKSKELTGADTPIKTHSLQ